MTDEAPGEECSTHSPIRKLPPELLAEVFKHCTSVEVFSPVRLSHVSTFWRRTAITTPYLWRYVYAMISTDTPLATSSKVRTWLARSGCIPLHISLVIKQWKDDLRSILHHIRNHSRHWSKLTLVARTYAIARHIFQFFTSFPHHDMLSRVDLTIGASSRDHAFAVVSPEENEDYRRCITEVVTGLMDSYAPRFKEFNLATAALPYRSALKTRVGFPHLRTLRILDRNGMLGEIRASTLLYFLDKCPSLENLEFLGSNAFDRHDVASVTASMIHLPRLRELHIARTVHQRAILAHLSAPSLQILHLSWLNWPEVLIDDSYVPDPSEDSEELTEWSQSPYTDLLTGAGIRSLISCGAPPIRVLDMDFADIRSPKDFVWVFRRLPTLESFRIIGSDMSDKVLNALATENNNGTWLCPRLTSIEFSRCDLITGRGVVALATGRNPHKDCVREEFTESTGQSQPARLTKFIVEQCAHVDCESVAVMQYLLGNVEFSVGPIPTELVYADEDIQISF